MQPPPIDAHLRSLIDLAVREDLGDGDRTVALAIPAEQMSTGRVVARKSGVISGLFLIDDILRRYGAQWTSDLAVADGQRAAAGAWVATITGNARALLSAERMLLNFLGRLSGVATLTARYVDIVAAAVSDPAKRPAICDTRKTIPGFRALDKYAVRCGGGVNHRMGLYDGVMLKDNHLAALRDKLGHGLTLAQLAARIRRDVEPHIPLWLEVDTLDQLREALSGPLSAGGADIILVDNFTVPQLSEAVSLRNAAGVKTLLESSGGVTLDTVADIARTGVDRISIGALTHSAPVLDLSMEFAP